MKKSIIAAAAGALIFAGASAWAATNVSGTIQGIDMQKNQITLSDGKVYVAQNGVDISNLKTGDNVTISTETQNGANVIDKVVTPSHGG